jgi:hypothetical protein
MLRGLGLPASVSTIARLYRGLIDTLVIDRTDAASARAVRALGIRPIVTDTVMVTPGDARRLAAAVLRALDGPAP